nr:hypothetical protein [uncultured Dyadobacter sp.]
MNVLIRLFYIVGSILLVWFSVAILKRYKRLTLPQAYIEVDSVQMMLNDVRKVFPTVSTIGFNSNVSADRKGVLYFKSALALAPVVVALGESDTTLILNDTSFPALDREDYECLLSGGSKNMNYKLVRIRR